VIDVERSTVAPESLARRKSWADEDVLLALRRDFLGKCYLCERELPRGQIEVEHRRPRAEWEAGRFHWPNLFPACHYCNGRRPKTYPEAGLRDLNFRCHFVALRPEDAVAEATAIELSHIHSVETATTPRTRFAARELLDFMHDHFMQQVHPLEIRVLRARKRGALDAETEAKLRTTLSRRAPLTMIIRSLVDPSLSDLFD